MERKNWLIKPLFSRMDIHAYVRSRKLIHIGSIISIMQRLCLLADRRLIRYAIG